MSDLKARLTKALAFNPRQPQGMFGGMIDEGRKDENRPPSPRRTGGKMSDVSDKDKAFMDKHFKAGEYYELVIMVNKKQLESLMKVLKASNLNLAIMPKARAKLDFIDDTKKGTEQ